MAGEVDMICIKCHSAEEKARAIHLLCEMFNDNEQDILRVCSPSTYRQFPYVYGRDGFVSASCAQIYESISISIDDAEAILFSESPIDTIDIVSMI